MTGVLYEVYIDSLFLVNYVMGFYLLLLTGKAAKRTATRLRLITVDVVGTAIYCLVIILPGIPAPAKIYLAPSIINMIMIAVIYKLNKPSEVLRCFAYMSGCAFLFGGLMKFLFARFLFLQRRQDSIWLIMGIAGLGYCMISWGICRLHSRSEENLCSVRLKGLENELCLRALVDTGNSLTDPISRKPVSVVEEGILDQLKGVMVPEKIHMIPYHSVGKANGILEGYEIPELVIERENRQIRCQKAVVGISRTKLSAKGAYSLILHPDLLEAEN